jgi:hypothetical protein
VPLKFNYTDTDGDLFTYVTTTHTVTRDALVRACASLLDDPGLGSTSTAYVRASVERRLRERVTDYGQFWLDCDPVTYLTTSDPDALLAKADVLISRLYPDLTKGA